MKADFEKIYDKVAGYEGGYVNDPDDTGGETYAGISRNNFPKWEGWDIIDGHKHKVSFPHNLSGNYDLLQLVIKFYKKTFWDVFNLDNVPSYEVCYELFEQAINQGVGRASKHIQQVCNALNYQNKFGPDLVIDGRIGTNTRARLLQVASEDRQTQLALASGLNSMQGYFYVHLGSRNHSTTPTYRKYMKGWLSKRNEGYKYE